MKMITVFNNSSYEVKQTGARFFYFSPRAGRWMPIAKSKVKFVTETYAAIQ